MLVVAAAAAGPDPVRVIGPSSCSAGLSIEVISSSTCFNIHVAAFVVVSAKLQPHVVVGLTGFGSS